MSTQWCCNLCVCEFEGLDDVAESFVFSKNKKGYEKEKNVGIFLREKIMTNIRLTM